MRRLAQTALQDDAVGGAIVYCTVDVVAQYQH